MEGRPEGVSWFGTGTATPEDDRGEKAEPRRYALLTLIRHGDGGNGGAGGTGGDGVPQAHPQQSQPYVASSVLHE